MPRTSPTSSETAPPDSLAGTPQAPPASKRKPRSKKAKPEATDAPDSKKTAKSPKAGTSKGRKKKSPPDKADKTKATDAGTEGITADALDTATQQTEELSLFNTAFQSGSALEMSGVAAPNAPAEPQKRSKKRGKAGVSAAKVAPKTEGHPQSHILTDPASPVPHDNPFHTSTQAVTPGWLSSPYGPAKRSLSHHPFESSSTPAPSQDAHYDASFSGAFDDPYPVFSRNLYPLSPAEHPLSPVYYAPDDYYPPDEPEKEMLVIPTRFFNTIIGIFLLLPAVIWSQTFFSVFKREAERGYWATDEFRFFCLGGIICLLACCCLPRRLVIYVYVWGHEMTHAIWVWLMGGHVSGFRVGLEGGHILTDKSNVWIALAPYFYPIYSVGVIIIYALCWLFLDREQMSDSTRWLFLALGITWTFHFSFSLWMIAKGQRDLDQHGTFFSLVLIYLVNLALISGLVLLTAPHVTLREFGRVFFHNTLEISSWLATLLRAVWAHVL